jgi:hypothetical protein
MRLSPLAFEHALSSSSETGSGEADMAVLGRGSLGRGGDGSPRVWEVRARWRSVRACDLLRDRARVSRRFRKALAGGLGRDEALWRRPLMRPRARRRSDSSSSGDAPGQSSLKHVLRA